jgi:hypothetical protein
MEQDKHLLFSSFQLHFTGVAEDHSGEGRRYIGCPQLGNTTLVSPPTISFKRLGTDATKPLNFNKRQSPPPPVQCCVPFLVGFDVFWLKQH